jgi:hypothetical protein
VCDLECIRKPFLYLDLLLEFCVCDLECNRKLFFYVCVLKAEGPNASKLCPNHPRKVAKSSSLRLVFEPLRDPPVNRTGWSWISFLGMSFRRGS